MRTSSARSRGGRIFHALPLVVVLSLAGGEAVAQSSSDKAAAESLFREGKKLMSAKKYAEACPKFSASLQLDPSAGGTALILAGCHELEGKTASAWAEFNDALAAATRDKRPEREKTAKKHIAALEPKLSRMTIQVQRPADRLELRRDGELVSRAAWASAVAVDPGVHTVAASAPGRSTWTTTVTVGDSADTKIVNVPELAIEQSVVPPVASSEPPVAAVASAKPKDAPSSTPPATDVPPPASAQSSDHKTLGYVLGAGGIVAIGVGTIFGLQSLSKHSDVKSQCPNNQCATSSAVDENKTVKTDAWIADVGIGVGVVALGLGAYFVFSSGEPKPTTTGFSIVPTLGRSTAGLSAGGAFL